MKQFKNKLSLELRMCNLGKRAEYYFYNLQRFYKKRKAYRAYIVNKWHEAFERVFPKMNLPQKSKAELKE